MTEQLRRFNEQCLTDLVSFVASQPKASARVLGEKLKLYVQLTRTGAGLDAEAVSRANFPFMEAKTADALEQLGWSPPENEEGNFRKRFAADAPPARTAEDLAKALSAYGDERRSHVADGRNAGLASARSSATQRSQRRGPSVVSDTGEGAMPSVRLALPQRSSAKTLGAASRRSVRWVPGRVPPSLHAPGKAVDGTGAPSLNSAFRTPATQ